MKTPACGRSLRPQRKDTMVLRLATAHVRTFYSGQEEDSGVAFRLSEQRLSSAAQVEEF